jgi:hypothetical protein
VSCENEHDLAIQKKQDRKEKESGPPRSRQVFVDLTVKFAKENPGWGDDRSSGALSKAIKRSVECGNTIRCGEAPEQTPRQ